MPGYDVDRIKASIAIDQVIGAYITLKQSIKGRWLGLCPFHREDTPSFTVFADGEAGPHYKCFGCGKSGDAITFVREMEGLGFRDAVKLLGDSHGAYTLASKEWARIKARQDAITDWYGRQLAGLRELVNGYRWACEYLEASMRDKPDDAEWLQDAWMEMEGERRVVEDRLLPKLQALGRQPQVVIAWYDTYGPKVPLEPIEEFRGKLAGAKWAMAAWRKRYAEMIDNWRVNGIAYLSDSFALGELSDDNRQWAIRAVIDAASKWQKVIDGSRGKAQFFIARPRSPKTDRRVYPSRRAS
jgi:hypothetical protein